MKPKTRILLFVLLTAFVAGIGALHFFTPGYMIFYHDTFRKLSYFPIAIGAILHGIWGRRDYSDLLLKKSITNLMWVCMAV